jgi:DNA-damage-inducible protein J
MAQTNINIRMDEELKKNVEKIFSELGLTTSAAFNIFAKAVVRERRIPFELSLNLHNSETLAAIDDAENNRNMSKLYNSVESLMEDLNA